MVLLSGQIHAVSSVSSVSCFFCFEVTVFDICEQQVNISKQKSVTKQWDKCHIQHTSANSGKDLPDIMRAVSVPISCQVITKPKQAQNEKKRKKLMIMKCKYKDVSRETSNNNIFSIPF